MPAYITLKEISKSFDGRKILKGVSMEIEKGSIIGVIGPSGSGKTTLLRMICGLEKPDAGTIAIDGRTLYDAVKKIDVPAEKRNTGMVFQEYALWPHMTVEQHIEYVLRERKMAGNARKDFIKKYLALIRMDDKAKSYPVNLSGGEKQRLALARALAQEPKILLLDEPFSNLDKALKENFRQELKTLHEKFGTTMLYVTHVPSDLIDVADKAIVIKDGEITANGTVDEILKMLD